MEDMETETSTALVQNDDPDSIKHKGCKLMVFRDIFTYTMQTYLSIFDIPTYLAIFLATQINNPGYLPRPTPTYLPTYPPTHLPTDLPTHTPTYPLTYLSTHLPIHPPTYQPTYLYSQ